MDTVKKVAQEIYDRIDNDLTHAGGDRWWQNDLGARLFAVERSNLDIMYMGYAIKGGVSK